MTDPVAMEALREAQAYVESVSVGIDASTEAMLGLAYLAGRIAGLEWAQKLVSNAA